MSAAIAVRSIGAPFRELVTNLRWRLDQGRPAPRRVKNMTLLRHCIPGATWVETGTYLGQTASFLSQHAKQVFTIEPSSDLAVRAKDRLKLITNIEVLNGTSEDILPGLLCSLSGPINFWLDGHFSAGVTFRGSSVTPIEAELTSISQHISRFASVVIFIDDVRLFGTDPEYPRLSAIKDWARCHNMAHRIENDILILSGA